MLVAAACTEIPEEFRKKPKERAEFVAEAIRKMLLKCGFKGTKAVTCLPACDMAVQHLRMAKMNDDELRKALPFEAQGKLPFDPGRAVAGAEPGVIGGALVAEGGRGRQGLMHGEMACIWGLSPTSRRWSGTFIERCRPGNPY